MDGSVQWMLCHWHNCLLKPPLATKTEYLRAMNKTYSMLSALDRAIIAVPDRAVVTVSRSAKGSVIRITAQNDDKRVVIDAVRFGGLSSTTYDVVADRYSRLAGKMTLTKTISFTTSVEWVEQWADMALAHSVQPG